MKYLIVVLVALSFAQNDAFLSSISNIISTVISGATFIKDNVIAPTINDLTNGNFKYLKLNLTQIKKLLRFKSHFFNLES